MTAAPQPAPLPAIHARRRKVPTILQFEAVECGAACLAMILARLGRHVPIEQLRGLCGVTRDGAKASNILKAARSFGLEAKGFRKEPAELAQVPMPAILHWNFEHFVVLEGIRGKTCWINDPAHGRRRISVEELDQAFTGVVLTFQRTDTFQRGGRPANVWALLGRQIARAKGALSLIALLVVSMVITGLVLPAGIRVFVDGVLIDAQAHWLIWLLGGMLATALLRSALAYVQGVLLLRLNARIATVGAGRLIWHLLRVPIGFFAQRHAAEVADRLSTNDETARLLSTQIATTAMRLCEVIFYGVVLVMMQPMAGAVVWALAAPNILALWAFSGSLRTAAERLRIRESRLVTQTAGMIQNIPTIRASGREAANFRKWAGLHAQVVNAQHRASVQDAVFGALPVLLRGLSEAAIIALGVWLVLEGAFTIGDYLAFQTLAISFLAPIGALLAIGPEVATVRTGLMRVEDAMRYPLADAPAPTDTDQRLQGRVTLSDVSFGYSPLDPPLISDVSLSVAPGQTVALVGASGSGKSTLGRLICGLLAPTSGTIAIDDLPLAQLPAPLRAREIAYVDQEIFLFAGTIRENLSLWLNDVSEADLMRALDDAALLDDVLARPGGLDAPLTEDGSNLSGGQRQRLEIARALVFQPSVIVLDEATAALDPEIEEKVTDNLNRRGVTQIVIAHRLSTIRDAHEIIVLDRGQIVERGTHDSLLAAGAQYAALIQTS